MTSILPRFLIGRFLFLLLLLGIPCAGGCQALQGYLDSAPKPSARVVGAHLADLNLESVDLVFDVAVDNPYSVSLPLANLDYSLASGGKPFMTGQAPVQGTVPAKGSATVSLPARLVFSQLFSSLKDVKPGAVVPYDAALGLSVDAPAVGKVRLPLKQSGKVPVPAMPIVELADVEWKGLDLNRTEALLHVNISNINQFALDLSKLSLGLSLGGHSIASTSASQALSIAPGAKGALEIPIGFSPKDLGLAAFQIIQGKGADYKLAGVLGANTPFGPLNVPYERAGTTRFKSR